MRAFEFMQYMHLSLYSARVTPRFFWIHAELIFSEFMQSYGGDKHDGWTEYVMHGGMPLAATMRTDEQKMKYLKSLFEEV